MAQPILGRYTKLNPDMGPTQEGPACLALTGGQQMCLHSGGFGWGTQVSREVISFQRASTDHTSTMEESLVDVSNTTGQIIIKEPAFQEEVLLHIMVTLYGKGQLFVQKNGKVPLRGFTRALSRSGSIEQTGKSVGGGDRLDMPLGVMVMKDSADVGAQTYQETGLLHPGDSLR